MFKAVDGVKKACAIKLHYLMGKQISVKKANSKSGKIFVGNLKPDLSNEDIKSHFSKFGKIVKVESPLNN